MAHGDVLICNLELLVLLFKGPEIPPPRWCDYASSGKVKSGQKKHLQGCVATSSPAKGAACAPGYLRPLVQRGPCSWPGREGNAGVTERMGAKELLEQFCLNPAPGMYAPEKWTVAGTLATSPHFRPLINM